jgi:hypothetical protein
LSCSWAAMPAGQREAVEGGGAAAHLVHQHQALRCGAVQDLRGLGHLQHEGRLRVGQVVGRADAGVDGVDRSEAAGRGGYVGAHAGQKHDQCHLPHVGALAAHVGAGDDLHALARPQRRVVGDEGAAGEFGQPGLDHGVATRADLDTGLADELRCAPVQRQRTLGQRAQGVQRRHGAGELGQRGHEVLQAVQQLLEQPFFPRQRPLLGAQRLVLEGLQLGRDEALGVLQRLAAAVVVGHLVELPLRDLDVEAMHAC